MKTPIFTEISSKLREELKFDDGPLREVEKRMVAIIAQNKDALVTAWWQKLAIFQVNPSSAMRSGMDIPASGWRPRMKMIGGQR